MDIFWKYFFATLTAAGSLGTFGAFMHILFKSNKDKSDQFKLNFVSSTSDLLSTLIDLRSNSIGKELAIKNKGPKELERLIIESFKEFEDIKIKNYFDKINSIGLYEYDTFNKTIFKAHIISSHFYMTYWIFSMLNKYLTEGIESISSIYLEIYDNHNRQGKNIFPDNNLVGTVVIKYNQLFESVLAAVSFIIKVLFTLKSNVLLKRSKKEVKLFKKLDINKDYNFEQSLPMLKTIISELELDFVTKTHTIYEEISELNDRIIKELSAG